MPVAQINSGSGIAFLVSAGFVAEIIAKACSSPQTAHLNAGKRADTLMLYVNMGAVEAVAFVAVAALIDRKHRGAIIAGGVFEMIVTYGEYLYAMNAGLADHREGTEDY